MATPKVPWTLSRQEKKDYDQIFRAWTGGEGGGYIEGSMAGEVFGQSGLGREDLMKIWYVPDENSVRVNRFRGRRKADEVGDRGGWMQELVGYQ